MTLRAMDARHVVRTKSRSPTLSHRQVRDYICTALDLDRYDGDIGLIL